MQYPTFNTYNEYHAYFQKNDISYFHICNKPDSDYGIIFYEKNSIEFGYYRNSRFIGHRLDGPAILYSDEFINHNNLTWSVEWWINDFEITSKITKWAKENDIDLNNLTEVDKALIKITWADYGK